MYEYRKPKLLDQMKNVMRIKHYSLKTEKSYIQWVRRFIYFHNKQHPDEMSALDVQKFLNYLAVEQNISASQIARSDGGYRTGNNQWYSSSTSSPLVMGARYTF